MMLRSILAPGILLGLVLAVRADSRLDELRARIRQPIDRETFVPHPSDEGLTFFGMYPDGNLLFRANLDLWTLHSRWWTYDITTRSVVSTVTTTQTWPLSFLPDNGQDPSLVLLSHPGDPKRTAPSIGAWAEIWNVRTGDKLLSFEPGHLQPGCATPEAKFSPDLTRMLHVEVPGTTLAVLDIASATCHRILQDAGVPATYTWRPDGRAAAVLRKDRREAVVIDTDPAPSRSGAVLATLPLDWIPTMVFWVDGHRLCVRNDVEAVVAADSSSPMKVIVRGSMESGSWIYRTLDRSKSAMNLHQLLEIEPPVDNRSWDSIPDRIARDATPGPCTRLVDGWTAHGVGLGPFGRQLDRDHGLVLITDEADREVLVIDALAIVTEEQARMKLPIWVRFEWFLPIDGGDRILAFLSSGTVLTFETERTHLAGRVNQPPGDTSSTSSRTPSR
jgi:hypothetical protein